MFCRKTSFQGRKTCWAAVGRSTSFVDTRLTIGMNITDNVVSKLVPRSRCEYSLESPDSVKPDREPTESLSKQKFREQEFNKFTRKLTLFRTLFSTAIRMRTLI